MCDQNAVVKIEVPPNLNPKTSVKIISFIYNLSDIFICFWKKEKKRKEIGF